MADMMTMQASGPEPVPDKPEPSQSVKSAVMQWLKRIKKAQKFFEKDFERMQANTEFAAGLQWHGQDTVDTDKYVANITLRTVNQKVAMLYARNPKATAKPKERLYYQLWDGDMMTLQDAVMRLAANPMDMEASAIVADYEQGRQMKTVIERVAKTLELEYGFQIDRQEPEFKLQMKQLVRRVVVTGVGFARVAFVREYEESPTSSAHQSSYKERAGLLSQRMQEIEDGDMDPESDPRMEQVKMLANSLSASQQEYGDRISEERLLIDFPPVADIIVDPRCRLLKGFVGARWIAQRYELTLDEVNAFFETDIKKEDLKQYDDDGKEVDRNETPGEQADECLVNVFEVFDKTTKSSLFVLDGYSEYLKEPEAIMPCLHRFWPVFSLTFNDVEANDDRTALYPPSDVQLMKHAQLEWNRTRNSLKKHRTANRPRYISTAPLRDEDKEAIQFADDQSVIELKGLPAGTDASKVFSPMQTVAIDPNLYNTDPLERDMLMAVGMQEANLGSVSNSGDTTATEATIAEQARLGGAQSNVDDLDDFLSDIAKSAGELLLWQSTPDLVREHVGAGAVWPQANRQLFVNEVVLKIEAASSGRPNKAMEVANFERLAPLLAAAGAPPTFMLKEGVKRLDDTLEIPTPMPPMPAAPAGPAGPPQPLQQLPSEAPVPLAGANPT